MRPILPPSAYQSFPSGPMVTPPGRACVLNRRLVAERNGWHVEPAAGAGLARAAPLPRLGSPEGLGAKPGDPVDAARVRGRGDPYVCVARAAHHVQRATAQREALDAA